MVLQILRRQTKPLQMLRRRIKPLTRDRCRNARNDEFDDPKVLIPYPAASFDAECAGRLLERLIHVWKTGPLCYIRQTRIELRSAKAVQKEIIMPVVTFS